MEAVEQFLGEGVEPSFGVRAPAPFRAVACVVHVLAFLPVAAEEAGARTAAEESFVRERLRCTQWWASPVDDRLDAVEEFLGDEGFVPSLVGLAGPPEPSGIRGVAEN